MTTPIKQVNLITLKYPTAHRGYEQGKFIAHALASLGENVLHIWGRQLTFLFKLAI